MRKHKTLSLLLALALCLGLAAPALAADQPTSGTCGDGLTWTLNGGTLTISGTGAMADHGTPFSYDRPPWPVASKTITSIVIDSGVTSIGTYAFYLEYSLASVTIPDSVTSIGDRAFMGCSALTSVTIPGSVTSIGESAFRDAGLTSVTIAKGVTSIGENAFIGCNSLTSAAIPDSVTEIGQSAFYGSGLTSVTISGNGASIGRSAFGRCDDLTSVTISEGITDIETGAFLFSNSLTSFQVDPNSQTYAAQDGVLFSKDGKILVVCPGGRQGAYTIPDGVTNIKSEAFMGCSGLTSVTIPSSVTSIGTTAFMDCSGLTSAAIPSSVTSIGWGAFADCSALSDIYYGGTEQQWDAISIDIESEDDAPFSSAVIHYDSTMPGPSTQQPVQPAEAQAQPTNDSLLLDGEPVEAAAYKIDGANYFKLRDVAALLSGSPKQFNVGYDAASRSAAITTGEGYVKQDGDLQGKPTAGGTATVSNDSVIVNGQKTELTVYKINGANYFKLRDLGKALDFNVGWSAEKGMYIESGRSYTDAD